MIEKHYFITFSHLLRLRVLVVKTNAKQLLKYTSTSNAIKKEMIEITLSSTFLLSRAIEVCCQC